MSAPRLLFRSVMQQVSRRRAIPLVTTSARPSKAVLPSAPLRFYSTKKGEGDASSMTVVPGQTAYDSSSSAPTSEWPEEEEDDGPEYKTKKPPPWYRKPGFWVLGSIPLFTLYLGIWQIQRLQWKMDLIDEMERKLKRDPLSLPKNIDLDLLLSEYTNRLFALSGRFSRPTQANVIFLGPRVRDGQMGFHVVQPMERDEGGGHVLVDRGFVSKDKIINSDGDPTTWRLSDDAFDNKSSTHLLILPPKKKRNNFTPDNMPEHAQWFFADVEEMRAHFGGGSTSDATLDEQDSYTPSHGIAESVQAMLGLQKDKDRPVLPVYMEEIFEGNMAEAARYLRNGVPIGRAATVEIRNQHAVYAATWFSLSAATSVMFALLVRRAR